MTRRELIEELVQLYPRFPQREVAVMVKAIFESMADALARGERIELRGFGSFSLKHRQAGARRNPRIGATVTVPARTVPFFRVAKELRLRVDKKGASARGDVGEGNRLLKKA